MTVFSILPMMNRQDLPLLLPTAYLAPRAYYSAIYHAGSLCVEVHEYYMKQTLRNHCLIAGPKGPFPLTIPIVKPESPATPVHRIRISDHGHWRHLHWRALQSAYGRTPFFEFYEDDFRPFYQPDWEFLTDYNRDLLRMVCGLIGFQPEMGETEAFCQVPDFPAPECPERPHYQIFASRNGFIPGLSIVDLLFNMGPESILFL